MHRTASACLKATVVVVGHAPRGCAWPSQRRRKSAGNSVWSEVRGLALARPPACCGAAAADYDHDPG